MPFVYDTQKTEMWTDITDLLNDVIQIGLSTSVHVPINDDDFLDEAGADDFVDGELSGTGYVGGFGGSGRLTLTSKTILTDKANNRSEFDCADLTWTAIDAGTAAQATVLKEITNDAASVIIANIDGGFPVVTNGGDFTIQVNAEGLIQLT